ncbi:MAG: response regulator transcription factor [Eggerthellaceae bacterium]|nr:response regulator transcription factor [Eggerthellaceae bacterium]
MSYSAMHVVVCDGYADARARHTEFLKNLEQRSGKRFVVHEYATGSQLLFDLDDGRYNPDIILLEAILPESSGIETAHALRDRGYEGALIFVTSTPRFVFDAFDLGAFNYVLKDDEGQQGRFAAVINSAVSYMSERTREYILINGITDHRSIAIDSIQYFESRKHICIVHFKAGEEMEFISSLSRIENALRVHRFVRIHRSFLVNCDFVERYTFRECALADGTVLPIGRQRFPMLKAVMEHSAMASAGKA